jgi:undecaprenyl-diphosphatase
VGALLAVIAVWALVGLVYTDWFAPNALTDLDEDVAVDFATNRNSFLNSLSTWAAFPADTFVKVVASAIVVAAFLWWWRRWYEALYIALALVFEALAFITITHLVSRPRPDVPSLISEVVETSFPSGHVAAATVYGAVAVIVFLHTRAVWARTLAVAGAVLITLGVAWARMYQGMHFLTDVLAGMLLGVVSLAITHRVLSRAATGPERIAPATPQTTITTHPDDAVHDVPVRERA